MLACDQYADEHFTVFSHCLCIKNGKHHHKEKTRQKFIIFSHLLMVVALERYEHKLYGKITLGLHIDVVGLLKVKGD